MHGNSRLIKLHIGLNYGTPKQGYKIASPPGELTMMQRHGSATCREHHLESVPNSYLCMQACLGFPQRNARASISASKKNSGISASGPTFGHLRTCSLPGEQACSSALLFRLPGEELEDWPGNMRGQDSRHAFIYSYSFIIMIKHT